MAKSHDPRARTFRYPLVCPAGGAGTSTPSTISPGSSTVSRVASFSGST